jgi:carbon starvation protein
VGNFVSGVAVFANNIGIPLDLATIFAAVVVISFAATTMDTGVRLQRYVVQEIGEVMPRASRSPATSRWPRRSRS